MIVYNLTHICVNLLRTVVFVVTLTIFTFITRSNLCSDSNPISDLYVFDLRAYSYCRTNNLMPFQTVLTFVWYRISRTRYPATRGASKAPHPEVRVWTSEPQTLRLGRGNASKKRADYKSRRLLSSYRIYSKLATICVLLNTCYNFTNKNKF